MSNSEHGRQVWYFPDGDLPQRDPDPPFEPKTEAYGHESLVILNPSEENAKIDLTVYFPVDSPARISGLEVKAERVRCYRLDEPLSGGYRIPVGQYALCLQSTVPVIAQIGRMDVKQPNLAYFTTMGFGV